MGPPNSSGQYAARRGRPSLPRKRFDAAERVCALWRVLDHALQFHGDAHIAFDLDFPAHKCADAIEFTVEHGLQVFCADADGAVGFAIFIGNGVRYHAAVNHDEAVGAAIEFQTGALTAVLAHFLTHGFGDGLQAHRRVLC